MNFVDLCDAVRFRGELDLFRRPAISGGAPTSGRRAAARLNGLQVTVGTLPRLHRICERLRENLNLGFAVEAYVVNDPTVNAYVLLDSGDTAPIVVLSSALVTLLDPLEIEFVIAHELGHYGMHHGAHHNVRATGDEHGDLMHLLHARACEISADRVGLIATKSVLLAARVMIKTACGLSAEHLGFDISAFIAQCDSDYDSMVQNLELNQTHPSLPFRLWALIQFSTCNLYNSVSGQSRSEVALAVVDERIRHRMLGFFQDGAHSDDHVEKTVIWVMFALHYAQGTVPMPVLQVLSVQVPDHLFSKARSFLNSGTQEDLYRKASIALERSFLLPVEERERMKSQITALLQKTQAIPGIVRAVTPLDELLTAL
jgi:hypothetical protein